jgi:mitochondrial transcription factor 1
MAMFSQSLLHTYGSVRILAWVPMYLQRHYLPQHVMDRRNASCLLTEKITNTSTVVTSPEPNGVSLYPQQRLWSLRRAIQAADRNGIQIPRHRQAEGYQAARESLETTPHLPAIGGPSLYEEPLWQPTWYDEFIRLSSEHGVPIGSAPVSRIPPGPNKSRLIDLRKHWNLQNRIMTTVRDSLGQEMRVHELEQILKHGSPDADMAAAREEWLQRKQYLAKLRRGNDVQMAKLGIYADMYWSTVRDPPLLAWDNRPYDPLVAQVEEFWPQDPLALLDIQPKDLSADPLLEHQSYDSLAKNWQTFMTFTKQTPTRNIVEGLKRLAPGADEALIKAVPELTDPDQGGRLDPTDLSIRTVPIHLYEKLFQAYEEWPFKPSSHIHSFY